MAKLDENIKIYGKYTHSKASEEYLDVTFHYLEADWSGWIPIVYRRTGLNLTSEEEIIAYLNKVYNKLNPSNYKNWCLEQEEFWKYKPNAFVTRTFYEALSDCKWHCVNCQLPNNPNWARRIQDLKEFGYTIATDTNRYCSNCKAKKTHLMLLPLKRLTIDGNGYETWSPELRKRIVKVLRSYDVYDARYNNNCQV